jgi:hypothetical protein
VCVLVLLGGVAFVSVTEEVAADGVRVAVAQLTPWL